MILGSRFKVHAPSEWVDLLEMLWRPFVTASGGDRDVEINLAQSCYGSALEFGSEEVFESTDPWIILLRIRVLLARWAMDSASQLVGLHGALMARDDQTIILSGPAGAGKSTLAADLALRGWSFGSDDLLALDDSGDIVPLPLPPAFKDPEAFGMWRGRWEVPVWLPPPEQAFCIPAVLLGEVLRDPSPVTNLAQLERGKPAGVTPLSVAEAAVVLAGEGDRLSSVRLKRVIETCRRISRLKLSYRTSEEAELLLTNGSSPVSGVR